MSEEHAETGHRAVGNGVTAGAVVSVYQSVWRAEMGGAAAIVLAVAALLIYRRRQAWTEMTGDAGLSSLPPETYRQP